ncbi:MAG: 5-carboxymethyl-2-hydroxymuconate Delta-isomerase [Cocleimonas sp.]|nr:5-carboxymethyl-2-hydroxymuconate Delta-isomerase [Cocleimonas sp.]
MPHCIIEYSKELESEINPKLMINAAHHGALASTLFKESHIKSRTVSYQHYKTGANDLRFIHITLRILSGRTLGQKTDLSQHILSQFKALLGSKNLSSISVTVEVSDMERDTYSKIIL